MPRALDPGTLNIGSGLAANESIETSALIHPTAANEGLRVHIADPSRAHEASAVSIADAAALFTSDEVEGALAELAASGSGGRQSGLLTGGTYTAAGLTVTMDPTTVLINGTGQDYTGESVALTDFATNWLYINATTGLLSASAGAAPPSITSPEHVLLWKIDANAGTITDDQDARFFVLNIDRKLTYTIRNDGGATDRNSEAQFETIEAAFLWLEHFTDGSTVSSKSVLTMRGLQALSTTLFVPVHNLTIVGEGGGGFLTNAVVTMFDLNGKTGVTFRKLTFTCDHATSIAIQDTAGAQRLTVEDCEFRAGGARWGTAVDLTHTGAPSSDHRIRDCVLEVAGSGIVVNRPLNVSVVDCEITGDNGAVRGILLGSSVVSGEGRSKARGCHVESFFTAGIDVKADNSVVSGCTVEDVTTGISMIGLGAKLTDCSVDMSTASGVIGVSMASAGATISKCQLRNPRTVWSGVFPAGITTAGSDDCSISDCLIEGFFDTSNVFGLGIEVINADRVSISGVNILKGSAGIKISSSATQCKVVNCDLRENVIGIESAGDETQIANCRIDLSPVNSLAGGLQAIKLTGANTSRVVGCILTNPRTLWTTPGGQSATGIWVDASINVMISDCRVSGFLNDLDQGIGIYADNTSLNFKIKGCSITGSSFGIFVHSTSVGSLISQCDVVDAGGIGIWVRAAQMSVVGCRVSGDLTVAGIVTTGADTVISGCVVEGGAATMSAGFSQGFPSGRIDSCAVIAGAGGVDIAFRPATSLLSVLNNCISKGADIAVKFNGGTPTITGCQFSGGITGIVMGTQTERLTVANCVFDTFSGKGIDFTGTLGIEVTSITGNRFLDIGEEAVYVIAGSHDVTISDNIIEGGGVTTTAIRVLGTLTDRTRRVVIADNNISAFTGDGIGLGGYVQNCTITGNQIDGFLGAGVDGGIHGISGLSAIGGDEIRYLTVSSNTIWRCGEGISLLGVRDGGGVNPDTLVRNLTIDGNVIHHCAKADLGFPNQGIHVRFGEGCVISNNEIFRLGFLIDDSDTEFQVVGWTNVSTNGILLENPNRCSVLGNSVSDLAKKGGGDSNSITALLSVNGAFGNDFLCEAVIIDGNRCTGLLTSATSELVNHISFVASQGAGGNTINIQNCVISNNVCTQSESGSIVLSLGDSVNMNRTTIEGNIVGTVEAAFGHGIGIFAFASGGFTDLSIQDNEINDIQTENGIRVSCGNDVSASNDGLIISGNLVRDATEDGIYVVSGSTGSTPGPDFTSLVIQNNVVKSPGGRGIAVTTASSGNTEVDMANCLISGNQITGVSGGLAMRVSVDGIITNLQVVNNQMQSVWAGDTAEFVCQMNDIDDSEVLDGIIVSGNVFDGGEGVSIQAPSAKLHNLTVKDNTFKNFDDVAKPALTCRASSTTGTVAACKNWEISQNKFYNNSGLDTLTVGSSTSTDGIENIVVDGNLFLDNNLTTGSNTSAILVTFASILILNVRVTNNVIRNHAQSGAAASDAGAIEVALGKASSYITNVNISDNDIQNVAVGSAIRFRAREGNTGQFIANLSVCRNNIDYTGKKGIDVLLQFGVHKFNGATNVEISDNRVYLATTTGISFVSSDFDNSAGDPATNLYALQIRNNSVKFAYAGGIYIGIGESVHTAVIQGNSVTLDRDAPANEPGIHWDMLGSEYAMSAVSFVGNVVLMIAGGSDLTNACYMLGIYDNNVYNLLFNSNLGSGISRSGVYIETDERTASTSVAGGITMTGNHMSVNHVSGAKDCRLSVVGVQRWENVAYEGLILAGNLSSDTGDGSWTDTGSIGADFGGTKLVTAGRNLDGGW